MRILLHICCGPCAITVLQSFINAGNDVTGFFFNPNIHPLAEYMRRREGAAQVAGRLGVPLIFADTLPEKDQVWSDAWLRENARASCVETGTADGSAKYPPAPAADPVPWLRAVAGRETERCSFCWRVRLRKTAEMTAKLGFEAFSSSLLYSRYQNHQLLRETGELAAQEAGVVFAYQDFRPLWQEGIRISKEWGVYRQQYCGCVFSEYERYGRDFFRIRGAGEEQAAGSGGQGD